jgi:dTMP kinase
MPARFITIEGIDGSGKSQLIQGLVAELEDRNIPVRTTREPTDSWLGEAVKRCYKEEIDPLAETMLFIADRAQHALEIKMELESGTWVISDRYHDSTVAYQAVRLASRFRGGTDEALDRLIGLGELVGLEPDLTLYLDLEPGTGLARIEHRDEMSRFEREEYLQQVRSNYRALAGKFPRIRTVDASKDIQEVLKQSLVYILEGL